MSFTDPRSGLNQKNRWLKVPTILCETLCFYKTFMCLPRNIIDRNKASSQIDMPSCSPFVQLFNFGTLFWGDHSITGPIYGGDQEIIIIEGS